MSTFHKAIEVAKVDAKLGLAFGYAVVCSENGEPYYDRQGDHIPESAMLSAAADFMANSRTAKVMHDGEPAGSIVFAWPLTSDVAKALDITAPKTGLLVAAKFDAATLAKFESGEFTGFSIGGSYGETEEIAA